MKKLISSILVLAMVLSLFSGTAIFASAEETTAVAMIGGEKYATFAAAVKAIGKDAGETTITLLDNVEVSGQMIGHQHVQNVILDLNGHTLTSKGIALTAYRAGTTLTVQNGTVIGNSSSGSLRATYNGKLILGENLTVRGAGGGATLVYTSNGTVEIAAKNGVKFEGGKVDFKAGVKADVINVAAKIGRTYFGTLADAVAAAKADETVTLMAAGQTAVVSKAVTINKDGFTATVTAGEGFVVEETETAYVVTAAPAAPNVAKIGEAEYATLADAIAAAQAGATITFLADITEDVTVDKAVTIDGADKTYTGAMILTADTTIKNVNFDGKGFNGYAITTRGAEYLTIEDCTAVNYGYGFVQLASATVLTTVKNVTVSNMNYGVKVDYSGAVVIENADITVGVAAVLNSNYGGKTITIKNSKLNILGTWTRNNTIKTTYVFEGANTINKFVTDAAIDNFKLAAEATLTAPQDITVITDVKDGDVVYADGTYSIVVTPKAAEVNGTGYETLAAAIAAAKDGETVTLLADVSASEIIVIDKAITLDGNDKVLTSTAGRAINIDCDGEVTIKNLTINASGERAINVIQKPATLTIDNVKATASNYTVNVATSAGAAKVAITNSTLDGLCTVNVAGAGAQVTVDNSTVNCNDNNTTAGESYAALCLNKDAKGGSIVATNSTITVVEGSDSAKGRNGAENGTVTINGSTDDVVVTVAYIAYEGQDSYYGFASLAAAIEFAKDGDTITLLNNISVDDADLVDLDGYYTFFKVAGKSITIDLNGKTVYADASAVTGKFVVGVFSTAKNGHLTLTGNGTVKGYSGANQEAAYLDPAKGNKDYNYKFYSLLANYDNDCSITVNGGNYVLDYAGDSLAYTSCNEGIVVNGGTFKLGNLGGIRNGMPWIFNARGQNQRHVVVNGGSFNADVLHQYWIFEVEAPKELALKNENSMYTVVPAVAYVNEQHWSSNWYTRNVGYATLEEAKAAVSAEPKVKVSGGKTYTAAQEYVTVLTATSLNDAIANGVTDIALGAGEYTLPSLSGKEGITIIGAEDGSTVVGGENASTGYANNFGKDTTIKNVTFAGSSNGVRWSYANGGTSTFENCTFAGGSTYGFHMDQSNGATLIFNYCTFSGFNAFAGDLVKVVFNNCTFLNNGNYGHTNIWSVAEFNNCTFGDKTSVGPGKNSGAKIYFNGVEESYHHEFVGSAESLFAFADSVNNGGDAWKGQKVVLVADIDLNNQAWTPIGQTGSTQFQGTFDGNGYTIKNLNIDSSAQTGANYSSGLFGWLNNAVVKNLTIENATVTGNHNVAVIAGYLESAGCTISECHVINAAVVAKHANGDACGDKVGVIVGHAGNAGVKVENCSATDCTVVAGRDAGQIAGAAKAANVVDCTATNVTVTAGGDCTGANIKNEVIGRVL